MPTLHGIPVEAGEKTHKRGEQLSIMEIDDGGMNTGTILAIGLVVGGVLFAAFYDPMKSAAGRAYRGYKERQQWLEAQDRYYRRSRRRH